MSSWSFVALLHNLSLQEPVENEYVAIVPETDARACELLNHSLPLKQLVGGFTDQFGREVSPSLLLIHPEAPRNIFKQDALIGFRNTLAICSIVHAWQEFLVHRISLNVLKYSNYFDLYPITVGKNGDMLVIRSPSILGMDEPDRFAGQISPELASTHRASSFYDTGLFTAILKLWRDRFVRRRTQDWHSRALFRSLEMAYHASAIPFENTSTIYDYGAKVALWVTAFEVLVRSEIERADRRRVLALLNKIQLCSPRLRQRRYTLTFHDGKRSRGTLSQKIYLSMHAARNDFLHGNRVGIRNLFINQCSKYYPLTAAAPILYKQALQSFLQIPRSERISDDDMNQFANIRNFEEALHTLGKRRPQRGRQHPIRHFK